MACNGCAKSFGVFRSEHGCPGCGFGYCKGCLEYSIFIVKLSKNAKVCTKCKIASEKAGNPEPTIIEPPKAYLKRIENMADPSNPPIVVYQTGSRFDRLKRGLSKEDKDIVERLEKLREDRKGNEPLLSDGEIRDRLAKLRDEPAALAKMSNIPAADLRTDQQKCDDLLMQYLEETGIEEKRSDPVKELEERLNKLKGLPPGVSNMPRNTSTEDLTEEEMAARLVKQIISDPGFVEEEPQSDEISSIKTSDEDIISSEENESSSDEDNDSKKKKK